MEPIALHLNLTPLKIGKSRSYVCYLMLAVALDFLNDICLVELIKLAVRFYHVFVLHVFDLKDNLRNFILRNAN